MCEAYVSLHRTEESGIGLAEAIRMGKLVIAIIYYGNTDFTTSKIACLVDYRFVPLEKNDYATETNGVWTQPNVDQAAFYVKKLVEGPDFGIRKCRSSI